MVRARRQDVEALGSVDVLHTMGGRPVGVTWTVEEVVDDTGRDRDEVSFLFSLLVRLDLVDHQLAPRALAGWSVTKLGAEFLRILQREGRVPS